MQPDPQPFRTKKCDYFKNRTKFQNLFCTPLGSITADWTITYWNQSIIHITNSTYKNNKVNQTSVVNSAGLTGTEFL